MLSPKAIEVDELYAGEVGYLAASIKQASGCTAGWMVCWTAGGGLRPPWAALGAPPKTLCLPHPRSSPVSGQCWPGAHPPGALPPGSLDLQRSACPPCRAPPPSPLSSCLRVADAPVGDTTTCPPCAPPCLLSAGG